MTIDGAAKPSTPTGRASEAAPGLLRAGQAWGPKKGATRLLQGGPPTSALPPRYCALRIAWRPAGPADQSNPPVQQPTIPETDPVQLQGPGPCGADFTQSLQPLGVSNPPPPPAIEATSADHGRGRVLSISHRPAAAEVTRLGMSFESYSRQGPEQRPCHPAAFEGGPLRGETRTGGQTAWSMTSRSTTSAAGVPWQSEEPVTDPASLRLCRMELAQIHEIEREADEFRMPPVSREASYFFAQRLPRHWTPAGLTPDTRDGALQATPGSVSGPSWRGRPDHTARIAASTAASASKTASARAASSHLDRTPSFPPVRGDGGR